MGGWGRTKLRQWWCIGFVFGVLMINYPILHIFNRYAFFADFPLLYLYFVLGWGGSVLVIALYAWALRRSPGGPED